MSFVFKIFGGAFEKELVSGFVKKRKEKILEKEFVSRFSRI